MKKTIILGLLFLLISLPSIKACTVAVVSGKATPDGRPLLWKHRDTDDLDNKVVYLGAGKYKAMALVNSQDTLPEHIWVGFNEAGFAIMNSASYNLKGDDTTALADLEGVLMKEALLSCATVADFEQFLQEKGKPLGVEANFGVIDALGGAAFFETDNYTWTKIDVNDQRVAPHGYVVRTNYSFTGDPHDGAGYIRFEFAEKMFYRASGTNNLSVPYMVEHFCIAAENPLSRQSAREGLQYPEDEDHFFYFQDCTNRFFSSASVIVQGVRQEESPLLTTMWSMVGFPLASVVIPVWITPNGTLPQMITAAGSQNAPVCDKALELKKQLVPSTRGSTKYYLNATRVYNADGTGITQRLIPVNQAIIKRTNEHLEQWRNTLPTQKEVDEVYRWIDLHVKNIYQSHFGI